ncbi:MAG TPA: hypothetical protein VHZ81_06170 [Galbitalea sp.]|nr:hypothetical protein [Galbitalea sp.]
MRIRTTWAWIGIAAQLIFTALWLVAPLWQGPRYNGVTDSISDMYAVTAPACRVIVVIITVCGAATILFLIAGLLPSIRTAGWRAWLTCILLALSIFGLGDLLTPFEQEACRAADSGCTPADQLANAGGSLDDLLSTIGVVLLVIGGVFAFVSLRKIAAARSLAMVVLVLAIATGIIFVVDGIHISAIAGLLERAIAILGAATFVVLAWVVLRSARNVT